MFHSLRLNIFIYYFVTVMAFLIILHYFLSVVMIQNILLLSIFITCFVILSGIFISKLAVDPLQEHVRNLQNLSKETLHELNLPISTIMTNTHMIKKHLDNEKDRKRLERIELATSMLQQRYNELDYMIKSQTLQVINEDIQLEQLVKQRVDFLHGIYPHIEFDLELEKTTVHLDKIGLSKAIDNVIDNGVKYSQKSNKINIKLKNNVLSIQDYGCGMDEVELLKIFDNYYQSNENMKGFGIGLGMVKRFCDTSKILLNFQSEPNVGTTVLLDFKENI